MTLPAKAAVIRPLRRRNVRAANARQPERHRWSIVTAVAGWNTLHEEA